MHPQLHILRVEPVDMEQSDFIQQVTLHRRAIVHVHELTGDQPSRNPPFGHPGVRQSQKVTVKPRQATKLNIACVEACGLDSRLLTVYEMMMTHVRRIEIRKVKTLFRRRRLREVR